MINYKEIEQGSFDWHHVRWAKVGGTLCKGLFVDSDTLFIDIFSQKTEDFQLEEGFQNDIMIRGQDMQPEAMKFLNDFKGLNLKETGWLQCEENELIGFSPDGISDDETVMAEIKCFQRKEHAKAIISKEIPDKHIHQCLHAFVVNPKLEKLYFIAYRPENNLKNYFMKELTKESYINLGTKAKPVMKKVSEWVEIARKNADDLLVKINETIESLKF